MPVRLLRIGAGEHLAGLGRASEQQSIEAAVGRKRAPFGRPALDHPHHAFGNASLAVEIDQHSANRGRMFGWFEHHRIARDQRRNDVAVGKVCRERSEEQTSELQSLMRISYAVFCLKKKRTQYKTYKS